MAPQSYAEREREADVSRRRDDRAAARDVEISPVRDPKRRERCEADPELWLKTYMPKAFYKPFSRFQSKMIAGTVACMENGGQKLYIEHRGGGKSTTLRGLQLYGTLTGLVRYSPIVGKSAAEGRRNLKMQKTLLESTQLLLDDYPEVCCFVRALSGVAQRAKGMTYQGKEIYFEWLPDMVRLPWVPGSKSAGAAISATGIEGGSIRGISYATPDGEIVRPDFYLLDDLQEAESARSALQCQQIISLIHADILGGYGHGELQAAAGAMTIISADDVADRLSNRKLYPTWNAEKGRMIEAWPTRMDLWAEYEEIVVRAINDDTDEASSAMDVPAAHAYYAEHRAEMDAGAVISSEHLHLPREGEPRCLSAVEYAMAFRIQIGTSAFESEAQNTPLQQTKTPLLVISPFMVQSRTSGIQRGIVPDGCTRLFVGVDIGKEKLHAVVMATPATVRQGHIVDYGIWPIQAVVGDARRKDTDAYQALDRAVYAALADLRARMETRPYTYADGRTLPIDLACVDVRFQGEAVNRFCDERPNWISFMGVNGRTWPRPSETCRVVAHIYARLNGVDARGQLRWRHYQNADVHKRFVHEGFRIDPGQPGSISLFGSRMSEHREYAEHICAESYLETGPNEFKWVPSQAGAPNHLLDCSALCFVGATRRGLKTFGSGSELMQENAAASPAAPEWDPSAAPMTKETPAPRQEPTRAPARERIRQAETLSF